MNIRTFKKLEDGVYIVTIFTESWSEGDKALMVKYGEPSINLGGDIDSLPGELFFELPDHYAKIMHESPFTQRFDSKDFQDADARAEAWKTDVQTKIADAVAALRALADTFTGEEVTTI